VGIIRPVSCPELDEKTTQKHYMFMWARDLIPIPKIMLKYDVRVAEKTIVYQEQLNKECRQFSMRSDNGMPDGLKLAT